MNVFSTGKIKDEPCDEEPPVVVQNVASSVNIIKSFLDSEYKPEDREYHYNEVKCLDEVDGKFKYFSELNCNEVIEAPEDCKNLCNKCNKQFNNMLAVQNHYIYSHPCSSMLTKTKIGSCNRSYKIKYNWLNEPIQCKTIPKEVITASPNIILKKVSTPEEMVNIEVPEFTLENIKAQPQDGIRVVKKTDINFNRLRMLAEQKILSSKNLKPKCAEADNAEIFKKTYTKPACVLFTKQVVTMLHKQQKPTGLKYLCRQCNTEMLDAYVFDIHMRRHLKSAFTCPSCTKTFCTKIGISKHSETCK